MEIFKYKDMLVISMKSVSHKIIAGVISGLVIGAGAGIVLQDAGILQEIQGISFEKEPQETIRKADLLDANSRMLEQMASDLKDKPVDYQRLGC